MFNYYGSGEDFFLKELLMSFMRFITLDLMSKKVIDTNKKFSFKIYCVCPKNGHVE